MVSKKDQDKIKRLFEEADKKVNYGDFNGAISNLDEIISNDPENSKRGTIVAL